ncbi:acetyl-CoA synthetase-like protein, partial [Conidiobolus coronatus NRRL 28638]
MSTELSPFQPTNKHLIKAELGHQWIEYQALNNPNEVSVRYLEDSEFTSENPKPEDWSYSKLNSYSNQIAQYLYSLGAQKGDYIVVSLPRIPTFYAALLAVMKVGGVYVPVDFQVPEDRRKMLVEESGAKFVISFDTIYPSNIVADTASAVYMNHEDICNNISQMSQNNLNLEIKGSDLSYLLFTSGTTGKPKGVMVTHSNLVSAIGGFSHVLPVHPKTRSLQFANCSFDVHLLDTFLAWSVGGAPCITDRGLMLNNMEFVIQTLGVTNCSLTSSVASYLDKSKLPNLEFITVGGESLSQQILDIWAPEGKLYNCYGPTEATIGCSVYPKVQHKDRTSNIGYLLHGCTGIILNPNNTELVLKGGVGELCIGGTYVADGYLNNEALTNEKFIDYSTAEGIQRFYRTGDLARFNSDGSIEFLGRKDLQVKINGIRIELEEISNNLTQFQSGLSVSTQYLSHPTQCTFVEIEDKDKLNQLLEFARTRLPIYMVPQYIFEINKVPMTPSGKVDSRSQILELFNEINSDGDASNEVWDDISLQVRSLSSEYTGTPIETIRLSTSIFQLGLDSLSSIGFAAKLSVLGKQVNLINLMKLSTVGAIADYFREPSEIVESSQKDLELYKQKLVQWESDLKSTLATSMPQISIEQIYPATPLQQGMLYETLSSGNGEYINSTTFKLMPEISVGQFEKSWIEVIKKHEILRTGFFVNEDDSRLCQVVWNIQNTDSAWKFSRINDINEIDQGVAQDLKDIESTLMKFIPPIRLSLYQLEQDYYLAFTLHHSLYDGWSIPLILEDVQSYYHTSTLPSRPKFREVVESAVEYILSVDNQASQAFWSGYLKDLVPTQFPSLLGSKNEDKVAHEMLYTSAISMPEVIKACKKFEVTPLTLTQAAWSKFLSLLVGEKDIVFGNVLSGRTIPVEGVEQMAGPCFNTVASRVNLADATSNLSLLQSIHKNNQEILNYVHTPLHSVLKWIGSSGAMELFNTLFLFQNNTVDSADETCLWTDVEENGTINYDVTIQIVTNGDSFNWEIICQSHITNKETMNLWGKQLDFILRDIIDNPNNDLTHLVPSYDGNSSNLELLSIDKPISPPGTYKFPYFHSGLEYYAEMNPDLMALHFLNSISEDNVPSFT